jgi:hypothetical protein
MKLAQARALKVGDKVNYPADRGDQAGTGIVKSEPTTTVNKNIRGVAYVWVVVYQPALGRASLWPSNKLSK